MSVLGGGHACQNMAAEHAGHTLINMQPAQALGSTVAVLLRAGLRAAVQLAGAEEEGIDGWLKLR